MATSSRGSDDGDESTMTEYAYAWHRQRRSPDEDRIRARLVEVDAMADEARRSGDAEMVELCARWHDEAAAMLDGLGASR